MSKSKLELIRMFDKFTAEFREALVGSGASHLSNDVVARAVDVLLERGVWTDKTIITFKRMGANGNALTTLTTGNKEAETVIEELLASVDSDSGEEAKPEPVAKEPQKPKQKPKSGRAKTLAEA